MLNKTEINFKQMQDAAVYVTTRIFEQLTNQFISVMYSLPNMFLFSTLSPNDYVGFTFFTGYMSMLAASIFFFFERQRVEGKWKASMLIAGLITFIAAVHYFYMRDVWLTTGQSPT